jgi:hypothetical protein
MTYFQPTITIDATNIIDHSGVAGITAQQAMTANVDRIGFILQNLSDNNELWWGYDASVAVGKAGYFCLSAKTADRKKNSIFISPQNGAYRGAIYIVSDGGGRFTLKEWINVG